MNDHCTDAPLKLPSISLLNLIVCTHYTILMHKADLEQGEHGFDCLKTFEVITWAKSTVWSEYGLTVSYPLW